TLDLRTQQKLNLDMAIAPLARSAKMQAQSAIPSQSPRPEIPDDGNNYASVIRSRRNIFIITMEQDLEFYFYVMKFVHKIGGKKIEFSMESESDGTHRLFQLLEILICKKEKVYIMDEINRSLHPKLTVQFVKKYFLNAKDRRIQLVTTTHESRLMSHDIVRRDEIWIADKNDDDSTKLFSLEDEQVRIDKVLDQNYMDNVWGGVPVFKDAE
ncbi:MAG: AAA family ATPase, partial [Treponema sp.]|nr:AAA family ATPase [Treponema sp.]